MACAELEIYDKRLLAASENGLNTDVAAASLRLLLELQLCEITLRRKMKEKPDGQGLRDRTR